MPMSFQTRNTYLFSGHMSSLTDRLLPCTFHQKDLRACPQEMCIYYSSTWQQLVTGAAQPGAGLLATGMVQDHQA